MNRYRQLRLVLACGGLLATAAAQDSRPATAGIVRFPGWLRAKPVLEIRSDRHAVAKDGDCVAALRPAGGIVIVDPRVPAPTELPGSEGVRSLAFSADGAWLLAGDATGTVRTWEWPGGKPGPACKVAAGATIDGLGAGGGGRFAWSDSKRGEGGVWSLARGEPVARWSGLRAFSFGAEDAARVSLARDGKHAFFSANVSGAHELSGTVTVWDLDAKAPVAGLPVYVAHATCGFAECGDKVYFGQRDSRSRYAIGTFDLRSREGSQLAGELEPSHFTDLLADRDGRMLAEGDFGRQGIRLHDLRSGKTRTLGAERGHTLRAFSADGTVLFTRGKDLCDLEAWDVRSGQLLAAESVGKGLVFASADLLCGGTVLLVVVERIAPDRTIGEPVLRFQR